MNKAKGKGLIYVFTGEGKGKTSAALGVSLRAVSESMQVAWVAWYKQSSWGLSELAGLKKLGVKVYMMGRGFLIKDPKYKSKNKHVKAAPVGGIGMVVDVASEGEHKDAARKALRKASELAAKVDVLVMDEVNNAVADKLIDPIEVIKLISKRGKTHIILTGRDVHPTIVETADLVTEMIKVKHPFDIGVMAVKGLDY